MIDTGRTSLRPAPPASSSRTSTETAVPQTLSMTRSIPIPEARIPCFSLSSHLVAAQGPYFRASHALTDRPGDETRGDRRAVVVQDGNQSRGVDFELFDQQ